MKKLLCYALHRRWHIVIWSVGLPFPLDFADYEWYCQRCDFKGGRGYRVPLGARA